MPRSRTVRRDKTPRDALVSETLTSLRTLVAALGRSARLVGERTGVTNAQLFLLRELSVASDATINALAERAMTSQSTVSILVTRLEDAGLVRRTRVPTDARQVRVSLTPKGAALARRSAAEPPTARLIDALERLPASELATLARSLDSLLVRLDLTGRESTPLFESVASAPTRPAGSRRKRQARDDA